MAADRTPFQRFLIILLKVILMIFALVLGLAGLVLTFCGGLLLNAHTTAFPGMLLFGVAALVGAGLLIVWVLRGV
ncbi:MAG TPA: hypothetical protein VKT22_03520 [Steroidobacteraceae bacterium]|nr:hypothetical protein [Steroidobacteraceae bacterium]